MSGGTAQRDGSTLPPSVRFTASTDRLRAAIDNLDAAAKAEFIFPDSPLGAWVAAQKDVLNALYVLEEGREEQLRLLVEGAKATAEAEAARAQAEVRRLGQFINKAEIELAQKQSESVKTIGDGIAKHVQGALVIRAKAYNTAKYLTTALVYGAVLLVTLLGGYGWSSHDQANSDEMRMWARCKATMVVDKENVSCSPVYPAAPKPQPAAANSQPAAARK